jgi:hypothetical protein
VTWSTFRNTKKRVAAIRTGCGSRSAPRAVLDVLERDPAMVRPNDPDIRLIVETPARDRP